MVPPLNPLILQMLERHQVWHLFGNIWAGGVNWRPIRPYWTTWLQDVKVSHFQERNMKFVLNGYLSLTSTWHHLIRTGVMYTIQVQTNWRSSGYFAFILKGWCTWHKTWLQMMMLGPLSRVMMVRQPFCILATEPSVIVIQQNRTTI